MACPTVLFSEKTAPWVRQLWYGIKISAEPAGRRFQLAGKMIDAECTGSVKPERSARQSFPPGSTRWHGCDKSCAEPHGGLANPIGSDWDVADVRAAEAAAWLQSIQRAYDTGRSGGADVGVDHRRLHVGMAQ